MAGAVKNLMVRAGADFSAITKQSKKAATSMREMQTGVSRSCSLMSAAAAGVKRAFSALGIAVSVTALINFSKAAAEAYDAQAEGEVKLARVMRNTMNASNAEIQSILDLTAAQQQLGVVGDEVQLAGAQELATYLTLTDTLGTLIPVMNDMAAQQYGYNVTAEQTTTIATMLGKVMNGQVGALSRYGYTFDAAQEQVLKFGTEAERAAVLAEVVSQSVGGMNAALAATPTGRMKQLSNTLGDIKEQFGQAVRTLGTVFLPLLNAVASILADVATLATKVAQTIANVFGGKAAGKEWQYIPPGTAAAAEDAADGMDQLAQSTQKAGEAAQKNLQQASFDTLHILADNAKAAGSAADEAADDSGAGSGASSGIREIEGAADEASEGIGWLQKVLEKAKEKWEDFKAGLNLDPLKESVARLKDAVAPLVGDVGAGLQWLWDQVLKPLGQWTINELAPRLINVLAESFRLLHSVIERLKPVFEALWEKILKPVGEWAAETLIYALDRITTLLGGLADLISGRISLGEFIAQLTPLETALLAVATALGTVKLAAEAITAIQAIKNIPTLVGNLGKLAGGITGVQGPVRGLHDAFKLVFGEGSILAGVGALLGGLVLAISNFVKQWQDGCSWINAALEAVGLALAAIGAVILGAPAAVAAAIAAIIFAVSELAAYLHEHWDEIKQGFSDTWAKVKDWGANTWRSLADSCKETGRQIKQTWVDARADLKRDWDSIRQTGRDLWANISQFGTDAWSKVQGAWQRASGFFQSNVINPIKNAFRNFINGILGFFEGMANGAISGINSIVNAMNRLSFSIPSWVPIIGGRSFGFNLPTVSPVTLPRLATGAVIPPNKEFAAILGDQKSGMNIETPERLLRDIVREEAGNAALLAMLDEILDAIRSGKEIVVDRYKLGKVMSRSMAEQSRAAGYSGL